MNESLNKNEKKQINIPSAFNQQNDVVLKNEDVANEFNNFFVTVGEKIANNNKGNKMDYEKYLSFKSNQNMFFKFIIKKEIKM